MSSHERAERLFDVWAPDESPWSAWAKPVLFSYCDHVSTMSATARTAAPSMTATRTVEIELAHDALPPASMETALVLDLAGAASIRAALVAARAGWRPVPLFNCAAGSSAPDLIGVDALLEALVDATGELATISLGPDAPPAFVLDADRLRGEPRPRLYDNRWIVFPQDLPSGRALRSHGIERVIWVGRSVRLLHDLRAILRSWKREGLTIEILTPPRGEAVAMEFDLSIWAAIADRLKLLVTGLRTNSAGGFGGRVPEPSSGGGFG